LEIVMTFSICIAAIHHYEGADTGVMSQSGYLFSGISSMKIQAPLFPVMSMIDSNAVRFSFRCHHPEDHILCPGNDIPDQIGIINVITGFSGMVSYNVFILQCEISFMSR